LDEKTSAWILSEERTRLRQAVTRARRLRIDGQRLGEVVGCVLRAAGFETKPSEVDIRRRVSRIGAERGLERRARTIAAPERGAGGAEKILRTRVIGMTVSDVTYGAESVFSRSTQKQRRRAVALRVRAIGEARR
jgi:hypothetical protein